MSSLLKKNSAKTKISVKKEDTQTAGLPEDMVFILGNPKSKIFRSMTAAAEKMGLTLTGKAYGPYRVSDSTKKALGSKEAR